MSSTGGQHPYADVSGRMEVFGRLFGEQVGIPEPTVLPSTESLIAVIRSRIPRDPNGADEMPIFEAAAFIGEWMRHRTNAVWIAEGPFEPHLQLMDDSRAIVYLLPLVQILRTASTAGYDGMTAMLDRVLKDVTRPAQAGDLSRDLRVEPFDEQDDVVKWANEHRDVKQATHCSLWRRCSVCAHVDERSLTLPRGGPTPSHGDWEGEAAKAAAILAQTPFACPCGGPQGSVTRFLMMRDGHGGLQLGDIYVCSSHTRVGCWTVEGDRVLPFDALTLTGDEMVLG